MALTSTSQESKQATTKVSFDYNTTAFMLMAFIAMAYMFQLASAEKNDVSLWSDLIEYFTQCPADPEWTKQRDQLKLVGCDFTLEYDPEKGYYEGVPDCHLY